MSIFRIENRLYSAAQNRELDRIAIEDFAIPGYELMQAAGYAVYEQISPQARSVAIVCGEGNNGGDGFVIGRLLLEANRSVTLILIGKQENIQGDALLACSDFLAAGGIIEKDISLIDNHDTIIDAIFGTGLCRQVTDLHLQAIVKINAASATVIAVDVPSGCDATCGKIYGAAVYADITVSFIGNKSGLFTGSGKECCGRLIYRPLQVPQRVHTLPPYALSVFQEQIREYLPNRNRDSHKGDFGNILIIGGNYGMAGAAILCALGALRSGAGLVTIATRKEHVNAIFAAHPEIMTHAVESAAQLQPLIDKADVIVCGCGLGQDDWAREMFALTISTDKQLILDADALNQLAQAPTVLKESTIITPHPGEAARLLNCNTQEIQQNRYNSCRELSKKYGAITILKGAGTIISSALFSDIFNAEFLVLNNGNPGMATAGMGDLLSGIIAGLCGQTDELYKAAIAAAWIHSEAADIAAKGGSAGMIASDLLPQIRKLI
ncbi:MAG: NAD(P)H-hydrate dehydratase [Gammaproteobacteria bacterium]|nr:MAG: NAD(P)H-hydrate dehydratase [Gammaproteobacteria bacterium]